jgi:DNA-binding CsgD family transcriptional regulator
METLTLQDVQELHSAIQKLYALHDFNSFGLEALAIVHELVDSEIPAFHTANMQSFDVSHLSFPGFPVFTAEMQELVHQDLMNHPIVQRMPYTLESAHKLSDFTTQQELQQLEGLYQQHLRPLDCEDQMCLFLPIYQPYRRDEREPEHSPLVGFSFYRNQRNFTERDRLILNLLRPHLFQAYSNVQQYHQLQQNLTHLNQSLNHLSLVVLNSSGQIQFITTHANQHLQRYFAKQTNVHHLPEHLWTWVKHQIATAKNNSSPPKTRLPLRIEQDGQQLVIRLVAVSGEDQYLLLLEEQTLSLRSSLDLLGLSPRETEVLYWVIHGKDNQAIALNLDIHISTVRKHLESIFHKLGVNSRTEAIAQALRKLGML